MNICTETFLGVITNHLADLRRMGGYRSGAMANHRASPMIVGIGGCGISVVQAFQRDFPESLENTQSLLLDVEADTGRPFVVGGKIHSKYISEIMLVVGLGGKAGGDFAMQRLLEISAVNLTSHLACEKFCIGILPLANEPILQIVPGAGCLYRYDTSLRMGAYLGLYPTRVFLQAGAYAGARRISGEFGDGPVPLARFPEAFHALAPFEVVNLLCIYSCDLSTE